jgi:hypothetical protein
MFPVRNEPRPGYSHPVGRLARNHWLDPRNRQRVGTAAFA